MATVALTTNPSPDIRRCNANIKRKFLDGNHTETITTYIQLQESGLFPDNFTFPIILKTASNLSSLSLSSAIHAQVLKSGYSSHPFVQTALINTYSALGFLQNSRKVFDSMLHRDTIAWNSILDAYSHQGNMDECIKLFGSMPIKDQFSFNIMISGFAATGCLRSAEQLFNSTPIRDSFSWNSMISAHAKSGNIDSAFALFNQMPNKNLVSWNTIMSGYLQHQRHSEVLNLFQKLKAAEPVQPNHVTLATALSACAHLGSLETGHKLHIDTQELRLASSPHVATALIDMYAKCGSIDRALTVFYKTQKRDLYVWNSMISGLAFHGYGEAALELFEEMQRRRIEPDGVTFVGLLSACSHSGLVREGLRLFERMESAHGVRRGPEHYGCVVDLLGRAGELERALEVVEGIPFGGAGVEVLGAVLGACLARGDAEEEEEVGERVVQRVEERGGDGIGDGVYVMVANMYAMRGRWEEGRRWREMMRERGVVKEAGCSVIEVGGRVYRFLAGDIYS